MEQRRSAFLNLQALTSAFYGRARFATATASAGAGRACVVSKLNHPFLSPEVRVQSETHPLESFFHQAVRNSYEGKLGLNDPDVTGYVARLLCEFSESEKLYKVRDEMGRPVAELEQMMTAADPINGTAPSFDAERMVRKHIGDYSLFVAGMYPEAVESWRRRRRHHPSLGELINAGKESYFIVSQFNLFEYEEEAPLFGRLSDSFERCILGLTLVREELTTRRPMLPPPASQ